MALRGQLIMFADPIHFDGDTYSPADDETRLSSQLQRVYDLMTDKKFRTLEEIHRVVGGSMPGVSARLRDFRKERFGGLTVNRRRRGNTKAGLFEYQLDVKTPRRTK